jgi:hypothetical protein
LTTIKKEFAMGMISLFRIPKPKRFKYEPVFYDERKEALKEREQQIKQELGIADETLPRISNIKGKFRSQFKRNKSTSNKSNVRVAIILVVLLVLTYFFFFF